MEKDEKRREQLADFWMLPKPIEASTQFTAGQLDLKAQKLAVSHSVAEVEVSSPNGLRERVQLQLRIALHTAIV